MYDKEGLSFVLHLVFGVAETCASIDPKQISNGMQNLLPFTSFLSTICGHHMMNTLDDESYRSYPCRHNFLLYHSCLTEYMHILSHSCSNIALRHQ
jgi:hypothetical protein